MSTIQSHPAWIPWHILKKDWKLLKWLVIGSAVVQALLAFLILRPDPLPLTDGTQAVAALLSLALGIALSLMIVLAVQQDALPGVTQDWLVRPIRRRDLLLAKLLFLLLLLHGPIIVASLLRGLAEGFAFDASLRAALLSNLELASVFTLPMLAIAAMTKSVTEALIGILGLIAVLVLTHLIFKSAFHFAQPTSERGVAWIWESIAQGLFAMAAVAAILIQYFRRATTVSRVLFVAVAVLAIAVRGLPWQPAFAIQKGLTADTGMQVSLAGGDAGGSIARPFLQPSEVKLAAAPVDAHSVRLALPLRVSGLPAEVILHADRTRIRVVRGGVSVFRGNAQAFDLRSSGAAGSTTTAQVFDIPAVLYQDLADQAVTLEISYSLTLLQPRALPSLPVLVGRRHLLDVGNCGSRMSDENRGIEVSCRTVGELPPCFSMALAQPPDDPRNPEVFECMLNYEPALLRFSMEPIDHTSILLPFSNPAGPSPYPIDAAHLHGAEVAVQIYESAAHLSRHLTLQQSRLRDLAIATADPQPNTGTSAK